MSTQVKDKVTIGCLTPLGTIIFLVFFFAKIYDKIDWSWWWVFSPLWIPLAIAIGGIIILGIIWMILTLINAIW